MPRKDKSLKEYAKKLMEGNYKSVCSIRNFIFYHNLQINQPDNNYKTLLEYIITDKEPFYYNLELISLLIAAGAKLEYGAPYIKDFFNCLRIDDSKTLLNEKLKYQKVIDGIGYVYHAIYKGQTTIFKKINFYTENKSPSLFDIIQYAQVNPKSRMAKAWDIVQFSTSFEDLFTKTHIQALNCSGIFSISRNFPNGKYDLIQKKILSAEKNSRTYKIQKELTQLQHTSSSPAQF